MGNNSTMTLQWSDTSNTYWDHNISTAQSSQGMQVLVPAMAKPAKQKKDPEPEGPMEWLDRRVEEMRADL